MSTSPSAELAGGAPPAAAGAYIAELRRCVDDVYRQVEGTRAATLGGARILDLGMFEARARGIASLRQIHGELSKLLTTVARYGSAADALHAEETRAVKQYLEAADTARSPTARKEGAGPWQDVSQTAKIIRRDASPTGGARPAAAPATPAPAPATSIVRAPSAGLVRRSVKIAERLCLEALVIPEGVEKAADIIRAVEGADLYYIPRWDHFAFRLGGAVFHGNIGHVYPVDAPHRSPERVKECRYGSTCAEPGACRYYHDPAAVAGSRDVRNFIAESWVYVSPASRCHARYGSRRLGSREALEEDIGEVTPSDARRQIAQIAHDVLCGLLLAKYVLADDR